MAPSKETRVSDTPTLSLPRLGRSPLIGRERELAILSEQLAEAHAGHCSIVLLSGPPGVGKSRLLEEFPPEQLASGVTVLRGGTSRAEGMPPYLPLLEALGEHIAAAPIEQLRSEVGSRAPILATLWPELTLRLGAPQRRYTLSVDQERFRLFEALASFLAGIAAGGTLVLPLVQ
jgi:predicted ATPase